MRLKVVFLPRKVIEASESLESNLTPLNLRTTSSAFSRAYLLATRCFSPPIVMALLTLILKISFLLGLYTDSTLALALGKRG